MLVTCTNLGKWLVQGKPRRAQCEDRGIRNTLFYTILMENLKNIAIVTVFA